MFPLSKTKTFLRSIIAFASMAFAISAHAQAPNAVNDDLTITNPVSQNATLVIPEATLIANDTGAGIGIASVSATSTAGASVSWNGANVTYNPTSVAAFIALGQGEFLNDTFTYVLEGTGGDDDTATVTVRVNGVNDAPVIGGVSNSDLDINDKNTGALPFGSVTISDLDTNDTLTVTVTIEIPAKGTLKNTTGVTATGDGSYTVTGTSRSQIQTRLRLVEFVPAENIRTPLTVYSTGLTIALSDGIVTTEAERTINITSVNDVPVVTPGTNPVMGDNATSTIFSGVTLTDPDFEATLNVSVTFNGDKGSFSGSGFTQSGSGASTVLSLTPGLTVAAAQTALRALVFTPVPNQVRVGQHENLTFAIAASDGTATGNGTLTVRVNSINDPPVLAPGAEKSFTVSAGGVITPFGDLTLTDLDVDDTSGTGDIGEGNPPGDVFTGTIVLDPDPYGSIVSSFFTSSGSPGTYTYAGNREQVQNAIRGAQYQAPANAADFTATVRVRDSSNAFSNEVVANIQVLQPAPGMTGLQAGQEVFDNTTINPFSAASFNNFAGSDRYIEITLDLDAKGIFENLGAFTRSLVPGTTDRYTYHMVGNTTDATAAIRSLRFKPTANRIIGVSEVVTFTIKVKNVPSPGVVLLPSSGHLSIDPLNVTVKTFNDAPTIIGASEDILINDNETAIPFAPITVSDVDEGNGQALTVNVTLIGEDPVTKEPRVGGGELKLPTGSTATLTEIGTYPNVTYQMSGTPAVVTATLRSLVFDPTEFRNAIGQRETVRFTITANDGNGGSAQYTQARVTVNTVSGSPVIIGIPSLAEQPFATPTSISNQVMPFGVLPGFAVEDNDPSITFTITLDNAAKGTFPTDVFQSSTPGVYTMDGSPAAITTAMNALVYTIDSEFAFPAGQSGLTTFTLTAFDGTNTTTLDYTIFLRRSSLAHIVLNNQDSGPGSLRTAISHAENGDTIVFEFADEDYPATITLLSPIVISQSLQIVGSGVNQLSISGGGETGIFVVNNSARLTLEQLTLRDGMAAPYGGAVAVDEGSALIARYCEFNGNSATQFGGAIDVFEGELTIENCLFVDNFIDGSLAESGGAISIYSNIASSITNSTFVNNRQLNPAGDGGGAVYVQNSNISQSFDFHIRYCTFKNNYDEAGVASAVFSNVASARVHLINNILADTQGRVIDVRGGGSFVSAGGNIATDSTNTTYQVQGQNTILLNHVSDMRFTDPELDELKLGDLTFNYGATRTCAPLPGSPALNNAVVITPSSSAPGTDQRGFWRPTGTSTSREIGAHEVGPFRRLNINEIFVGGGAGTDFIEFYNPRDSEELDMLNLRLWVDGTLVHTFEAELLINPGEGFAWFSTVDLNPEKGRIELRNSLGQVLHRVDYAANFAIDGVAENTAGQSINRYPRYEGGFLPHQRVVERVTGSTAINPNSPGDDVDGSPLGGGNAPPLAFPDPENLPAYRIFANEEFSPNVLANDIDFDRTDILKITEVMQVAGGAVVNAELQAIDGNGVITLADLPAGLQTITPSGATVTIHPDGRGITYDPTTSPVMIALYKDEEITDVWGYTILDYDAGDNAQLRSDPYDEARSIANITKATTWFAVTVVGVNEPPTPVADNDAVTAENHAFRFLADATLISTPAFDYGDNEEDFYEFDSEGNPVTLMPLAPTIALLDNDSDPDNDDDKTTLILGAVHTTEVPTDLLETTSLLGARVALDIRANRSQTNILYDPRTSAFLDSLREGEIVEDSFYYSVFDRHGARGVAKVTITVTGVNDVPMAKADDGFYVYEDMSLAIAHETLLANDSDIDTKEDGPSDVLTIQSVSPESALGAAVSLTGSTVVFDPSGVEVFVRLARNETLTDTFTYTISDSNGGLSTATVTVVVEGVNDAPVADNDGLAIFENQTAVVAAAAGLMANDFDIDVNGTAPNDDPWILPQREVITPLGAALTINPDGSFSYDANSAAIDSLFQGEEVIEDFIYTLIDNSRTTASHDAFRVLTNSTDVVLPVLLNDVVVGTTPVPVASYAAGTAGKLVIESPNHSLRDGLLVKLEGYVGAGSYNGVHAITSIGRDRFTIDVPFVDDPATRGTWIPWFAITSLTPADKGGNVEVVEGQSLLYTPTLGFYGTETFRYTIEDGVGGQDVATVSIEVVSPGFNGFVRASDDRFLIGMDSDSVVVDVLANDGILPGGPSGLTITAVEPTGVGAGILQIINAGTALAYTPAGSFAGVESFTYTVSGAGPSSATATVTFEVGDRADKIDAAENDFAVVEGSSNNLLNVLANDAVLPLYPISPQIIAINDESDPVMTGLLGAASIVDNQISYTPPAGNDFIDEFTYTVRDATGATKTRNVRVKVVANTANFHPIADHYIVAAGAGAVSLPVLANDIIVGNPGATLTITALGIGTDAPPAPERVSISGGQSLLYTPPATAATETFTYEVGIGTTERRAARITITVVESFATLPEAQPDFFHVAKDSSAHTLDVLNNDIPYPDAGWRWEISAVSTPSHGGTLSIINNGQALSYTPAPGFIGIETLEYTITDSIGNTDTALVTLRVGGLLTSPNHFAVLENNPPVILPVLANDNFLTIGSAHYTISAVTPISEYGGTVEIYGTGPGNAVRYEPFDGFSGIDTFTYTVVDSSGGTYDELVKVEVVPTNADRDTAVLRVTITGVNDIPVITGLANAAINDKETINPFATITITDLDEGGNQEQTATVSFDTTLGTVDAPGMDLVSAGTYSVTGTPAEVTAALRAMVFDPFENLEIYINPGQAEVVFSLSLSDGVNGVPEPLERSVTITVTGVNDPPDPSDDIAYTFENRALRLLADPDLLSPVVFNFGDRPEDFLDFNGGTELVALLPLPPTVSLLINDDDVDADDDSTTLLIGAIHTTEVPTNLLETTSLLGARVVLDIRADRRETNILYDPRGSAILNALPEGITAEDSFYYSAFDRHGARGIAKVTIVVTGVNDVPMALDDDGFVVSEDLTLVIPASQLTDNDTDPDTGEGGGEGEVLLITSVSATSGLGGIITLDVDGQTVTFDPTTIPVFQSLARNESITDTFTYTTTDASGGTSTATVTVVVTGVNDAPVAADDELDILENDTAIVSAEDGLMSNDVDVDINGTIPDDEPWILPQREVITPLGAALTINPDGSYTYDANSEAIDSLIEDEIATETFPYTIIDNFRTTASDDVFKVFASSTGVDLPVLVNDVVVGTTPIAIESYAADDGSGKLVIESANHALRDGLLIRLEGYVGDGEYNGVHAITSVGRDLFTIDVPFVDDPEGTRGTWVAWIEITSVTAGDKGGEVTIVDGQSLAYTPTPGFYGRETFTYSIKDGVGGQDVAKVEIDVILPEFNGFVSASDDHFLIGMGSPAETVDVLANDGIRPGIGDYLTITEIAAVGGAAGTLVIVDDGKALSYTPPDVSFAGFESFTYTVASSGPDTTTATVTFEVVDRTDRLDGSENDFFVVLGSTDNLLDVLANDPVLPAYPVESAIVSINGTPDGTAVIAGDRISYTPTSLGIDTFSYTARDASGATVTRAVRVRVVPDAQDFFALDDHYIILAGTDTLTLPVLNNDGIVNQPGAAIGITNLGLDSNAPADPDRVVITGDGLAITYTPPATAGTETFTYETGLGEALDSRRRQATVTITVVDVFATAPEAAPNAFHVAKNSGPHMLDILTNDIPLPASGWSWEITDVAAPSHGGEAQFLGGSMVSYTPAPGFFGIETFTYEISDEFGRTDTATVTIRVGVMFTAPDHFAVLENSPPVVMPVLTNDDLLAGESQTYTISAVSAVSDEGGAVAIVGTGPGNAVSYAPLAGFTGDDSFTYTVIDQTGATLTEQVSILVIPTNADRDGAVFTVTITGINDVPVIAGTLDRAITDKQSVNPFETISITDLDEWGDQPQRVTVTYDTSTGTVSAPGMTLIAPGTYRRDGTPAQVSAALRAMVFTPFENIIDYIDPGQADVAFNLVLTDFYVPSPLLHTTLVTVTPVNDAPTIITPIPDKVLHVNSLPTVVNLPQHFADVDDNVSGGQLIWSATTTNPALFASVKTDQDTNQLILEYALDQFGVVDITVRGTDRGGLYVETTFRVTVEGPPVIVLRPGETVLPPAALVPFNIVNNRRLFRDSFRVANTGTLPVSAFIVHVSNLHIPIANTVLESASYSTNENGTPNTYGDDTRSSVGVTIVLISPGVYEVKYNRPIPPGESLVVHLFYRVPNMEDTLVIRPTIRISLTTANPEGAAAETTFAMNGSEGALISFNVPAGKSYILQYSSDLVEWHDWSAPIPASTFARVVEFVDDGSVTGTHPTQVPKRFYRLAEVPNP